MSSYIRAREGNTFFFTLVTYDRRPILCLESSRKILRQAVIEVQEACPFAIVAWVLLPEHMHCIWELPKGDSDYSKRWGLIKKKFTQQIKGVLAIEPSNLSRKNRNEGTIWQRRFWEHQIRDEPDFNAHCDYIHYNPVHHHLASAPSDWPYSTFKKFVQKRVYSNDWGVKKKINFDQNIGRE